MMALAMVVIASMIDALSVRSAARLITSRPTSKIAWLKPSVDVDGLPVSDFPCAQTALVGGDGISLSIAAASVIAKVERDRAMLEYDQLYPEYGFAKHKGYPTAAHFAKLREHGPCPIHRRSFSPVAQAELW